MNRKITTRVICRQETQKKKKKKQKNSMENKRVYKKQKPIDRKYIKQKQSFT